MELSICIVTYNSSAVLPRCLDSIMEHRPRGQFEVIVVDNASQDGTVRLVTEKFPWVRLLCNERNRGYAAANNQAVEQARGQLILLLNPDTQVTAGALDVMMDFLRRHPRVGAVGPKLTYPDGRLQLSCHEFPDLWTAVYGRLGLAQVAAASRRFGRHDMTWWDHEQCRKVGWVSGAALMVTRRAWERVGPLDEHFFMYCEDVDWQMRLARAGLECWYVPQAHIVHHEAASWEGRGRKPMRALAAHHSEFYLYRKHYGWAAEAALRALTVAGALGRAAAWTALWLARGCRDEEGGNVWLHLQVAALAAGLLRLEVTA